MRYSEKGSHETLYRQANQENHRDNCKVTTEGGKFR